MHKKQAINILNKHITTGKKHKDYDRVVALAKEYEDIFTGIGISKYIKQFRKREDSAMFKQRLEVFESVIPSAVSSVLQTFNKALTSSRIIEHFSHSDNQKHEEIKDKYDNFYNGDSGNGVSNYLQDKFKYYNTFDPNAYLCVEFGEFDAQREKATAFPLEYTSEEVLDYEYKNGKLQWLLAEKEHYYLAQESAKQNYKKGSKYLVYIGEYCYVLYEVDKVLKSMDNIDDTYGLIEFQVGRSNNSIRSFYHKEFNLASKEIPLKRFGYIGDAVTKNRTCLSILHSALPYFKKEIKTGSEFDLTMSMHVFPQKIIYGQVCPGHKDKGCNNGIEVGGENICQGCGGSGVTLPVHTSAQDIVVVKPPMREGDPILNLENAVVYKAPPIDIVKFQSEYQERLIERAKMAVFPSESVVEASIAKSATESEINLSAVNDTLYPYGVKYAYLWEFCCKYIAIYSDNYEGVVIWNKFPKDLKLRSKDSLLLEAKLAKESGLNQNIINALNEDILEAQYADDQDTLTKLRVQNRFMPFAGKTESEIAVILTGDVIPYYKILYTYFNAIFEEIEEENEKFYIYPYAMQKEILKRKVEQFAQMIPSNNSNSLDAINDLLSELNNKVE